MRSGGGAPGGGDTGSWFLVPCLCVARVFIDVETFNVNIIIKCIFVPAALQFMNTYQEVQQAFKLLGQCFNFK